MNPNEPNYGQLPPAPQPSQPPYAPQPSVPAAPPAALPNSPQNPYDFIVNPGTIPKKSTLGSANKAVKLLLIVGGVGVLLIVVGLVTTSLLPKGTSSGNLLGIAQQQQEIVRIAVLCEQQAANEATKGFCYTTELSVNSSQSKLVSYMTDQGTKVDVKLLALKKDPATDKILDAAKASSTFDSTLKKVLVAELETYLSDVQDVYKSTKNQKLKEVLRLNFDSGKVLYDQAKLLQNNP